MTSMTPATPRKRSRAATNPVAAAPAAVNASTTITPSDAVDLDAPCRVTVTKPGTLRVVFVGSRNESPSLYDELPVGFVTPHAVRRVCATGTTATVARA